MGNSVRGEVSFEADGQSYTIQYTINWLIEMEEHFELTVEEIGKKMMEGMRLAFLRTVFWFGMRAHHEDMTETEAGALITALGVEKAGALIGEAFTKAFSLPTQEGANGAARPPKKRAPGTGRATTPSGVN